MAFKLKPTSGGYNTTLADQLVKPNQPVYSLSLALEPQHRFDGGKPTNEIVAYKAWFAQEGIAPFQVKFEAEIKLPAFLSKIQFDTLQACEVKNNAYFKADGIKEMK